MQKPSWNDAAKWSICAVLLAFTIFEAWSCSSTPAAKIAQRGVAQFRSEIQAGEFKQIYYGGDEALRKNHTEDGFGQLMCDFRESLGPVKETHVSRARESWVSRDKRVTLLYTTTWARENGSEKFVFVIRNGEPRLDSYVITAPFPSVQYPYGHYTCNQATVASR